MLAKILRRLGRLPITTWHRAVGALIRLFIGTDLISLEVVLLLRRVVNLEDALVSLERARGSAIALNNAFLAETYSHLELGVWSLGAKTLNHLEHLIARHKPAMVLEFGSGVSTACLAHYLMEVHPERKDVKILSIEQDQEHARRTRSLVNTLAAAEICEVIDRSLTPTRVFETATQCYDVSPEFLAGVLEDRKIDLVVIDGPSGPPGVRLATLPLVMDHLAPNARIVLDDALRDPELEIARAWRTLPGITIHGLRIFDKGLLEASYTPPARPHGASQEPTN